MKHPSIRNVTNSSSNSQHLQVYKNGRETPLPAETRRLWITPRSRILSTVWGGGGGKYFFAPPLPYIFDLGHVRLICLCQ